MWTVEGICGIDEKTEVTLIVLLKNVVNGAHFCNLNGYVGIEFGKKGCRMLRSRSFGSGNKYCVG